MFANSIVRSFCTTARTSLALVLSVMMAAPDVALAQEPVTTCTTNKWLQAGTLAGGTALETFSAVVNGQFMYTIGGYNGTTGVNSVGYVQLNSAGNLQSNFTATSSLIRKVSRDLCGKSFTTNGTTFLYTVGGVDYTNTSLAHGQTTGDLEYAPIRANGSVGTWTRVQNAIPATQLHASIVLNNYLYVIGGSNTTTDQSPVPTSSVYHAKINNDGTVGPFVSDLTLPVPTYKTCPVAFDNTIYLSGGEVKISGQCSKTNPTATTNVWYAKQGTNGFLTPNSQTGTWNSATSMIQTLASQAVVYNNGITLIGGDQSGCGFDTADIQYGAFTDLGDNPPTQIQWTFPYPSGVISLPAIIERNAGATYNNVIYSLGGEQTKSGSSSDTAAVYCLVL